MEKFQRPLFVIMVIVIIAFSFNAYSEKMSEKKLLKDKETQELQTKIFNEGSKLGSDAVMKSIIEKSNACQVINVSVDTESGTTTKTIESQVVGVACVKEEFKKQQEKFNKLIKEVEDSKIQDDNN